MANITAAMVKTLREKTGAGMMDCKKALTETDGDMDAAVDWLRKKGLSAAAKKSGRTAAEGLVAAVVDGNRGALVEVNAETDFVARNETFQDFVRKTVQLALEVKGDVKALKAADFPETGRSVADELTHMIATIGENMVLRRAGYLAVETGIVGAYVHGAVASGLGKIGVLVALESAGEKEKLQALAKHLAMHVAAMAPQAVDADGLDPAVVERERSVLVEQARASGKPEHIIEKMVEGRMRKFYQEVVLLEQVSVVDGEKRVREVIKAAEKDLGQPIRIAGFLRFQLGEGIEKEQDDFAAEVAAAAGLS